jgi:hypothetical protein
MTAPATLSWFEDGLSVVLIGSTREKLSLFHSTSTGCSRRIAIRFSADSPREPTAAA